MAAPLVTLTTDFGTRDPYVAAMKGVMYAILPRLTVVDLSHEISPRNILEGVLFLAGALPFFPEHTVHVAVVDPGVGGERHAIALQAGSQYLICPDNGLATCYVRRHPIQDVRIIENPRVLRPEIGATFHGRDIFAPAAAHLARGVPLHEFGPELRHLVELDTPTPRTAPGRIEGEVIHADHFGNLITNIPGEDLPLMPGLRITIGGRRIEGLCHTYADAPSGAPLALIGSAGYLEIAVNNGNARETLHLDLGQFVSIEF
ncbi:MAG: SAM-dependent chlorinase/fluorinase, partial [Candidatus Hydrogenedentes bacterium]|nr:SAM-dependent chlorinase/fluorinase [Candidatus Hydrogenedentota bacterium]